MRTAWRQLEKELGQVDAILFLLDARIPRTSRHHTLEAALKKRDIPLVYVLHKSDLADHNATQQWVRELSRDAIAMPLSSGGQNSKMDKGLLQCLSELQHKVSARWLARGLQERALKVRLVGLPNVGKSSLLNRLAGRGAAKTGKKPGLTRGQTQWIQASENLMVLDSPGILYPRLENWDEVARLAACGCIRKEVLPMIEVAQNLLAQMVELGVSHCLPSQGEVTLENLASRLGFKLKGGDLDLERAAAWLLQSCFDGKLGKITWERACDE